jgi:type IV secretory pathway VirB2 component (pilin)
MKIAETKVKLRILVIMLTMELAFGLNSFEQLGVGVFQVVSKFHSCL